MRMGVPVLSEATAPIIAQGALAQLRKLHRPHKYAAAIELMRTSRVPGSVPPHHSNPLPIPPEGLVRILD